MHFILENIQLLFAIIIVIVIPVIFSIQRIPLGISSFGALAIMALFFYFFPIYGEHHSNSLDFSHIFSGFTSQALIAVVSLMIMSEGLSNTGLIDILIHFIFRHLSYKYYTIIIVFFFIIILLLSSLLNNVPVVILFIPIIQSLIKRLKKNPNHYFLSISYMAILGGNLTIIGSSTNVLVSNILTNFSKPSLSFFTLTPIALIIAFFGSIYCIFILPKFISLKGKNLKTNEEIDVEEKKFITSFKCSDSSKWIGEPITKDILKPILGFSATLISVKEGSKVTPSQRLDTLGTITHKTEFFTILNREFIQTILTNSNIQLISHTSEELSNDYFENQNLDDSNINNSVTTEIMIHPDSKLIGSSNWKTVFPRSYGLNILGIELTNLSQKNRLFKYKLKAGDILLVRTLKPIIYALQHSADLIPMMLSEEDAPNTHHRKRALAIFGAVVFLAMTNLLPIALVAFIGALLMFVFKIISFERGLQTIDIRIVGLIVASIAIGLVIEKTGLTNIIAIFLSSYLSQLPIVLSLMLFFFTIMILTNLLSNQATAVIFTPIGLSLSSSLHIPYTFMMTTIIIAANTSFLTPFGYQTNLLVMNAGGYTFKHYIKFGMPLAVIVVSCFFLYILFKFNL